MHRRLTAILAGAVLGAAGCGGGGAGEWSYSVPPGSDPPPEAEGEFTDAAGRLYALVTSSASGGEAAVEVRSARDGWMAGAVALGTITPAGFSVDTNGTVFVGDRDGGVVHVVRPDLTVSSFPTADPRTIATGGASRAYVSSDSVTLAGTANPIALPAGGAPVSAAITPNGSLLAIARTAPAEVVRVSIGDFVSVAAPLALVAPTSCEPSVDEIAFARHGAANSWYALDFACGFLYRGGATQDTAASVALATTSAGTLSTTGRLGVDGWSGSVWIADGMGVQVARGGSASVVAGVPPGTTSLAVANAGTLVWVASATSGAAPVITRLTDSLAVDPFVGLGVPGSVVHGLAYVDRPPSFGESFEVHAAECDLATVSFPARATDPDGDPVDTWLLSASGNVDGDGSFDGETFHGTFRDTDDYGPDGFVEFRAMSGYYLTDARFNVWVNGCRSENTDEEEDSQDGWRGGGCACRCAVAQGNGDPSAAPALLGACALLSVLARRRRA